MSTLKQKSFINTFWNAVSTYTNQILTLLVSAVLARLLLPEDFGIIAMILVFSGFLHIYGDAGLGAAVIQFQDLDKKKLSTIFWSATLFGIILYLVFLFSAPYIASFYEMEDLYLVAVVMGAGLISYSVGIIPSSLLKKELQFKKIAKVEIFSNIITSIIAIILAFKDYGYWALIFKLLADSAFRTTVYIILTKKYILFYFNIKDLKDVWSYSANVLGFKTFNYWARNADNLLIGKFFGNSQLGYYNRAYSLMLFPLNMTTFILNPVLHPIFASIQEDKKKVVRGYYDILYMIISVSFPMMFFLSIMATEVIYTMWGTQWTLSISVFRILALIGALQTLVSTTGTVFLSANRSDLYFKIGVVNAIILVLGIYLGLKGGIEGVAIGYGIAFLIITLPTFYLVLNIVLNDSLFNLFKVLKRPALISFCLAAILVGVKYMMGDFFHYSISLIIAGIAFLFSYIGAAVLFNKKFITLIFQMLPPENKIVKRAYFILVKFSIIET